MEGNSIVITAKQELAEAGGVRTRVFEQKFSMPTGVKAELVRSSLNKEGTLVITAPRGNTAAQRSYTETLENKMDKVLEPKNWGDTKDDSFFDDSVRDVKKKDSFFDESARDVKKKDSFFDDSRKDFEERRKEFLDDFHKDSIFNDERREPAFDDLRKDSFSTPISNSRHGSIFDRPAERSALFDSRDRSASLFDEQNGGARVVYEDDQYKILINVEHFQPEELMIKTVDNNVIVEAKHEEKTSDGRSFSTKSFNQSFALPRGVSPETVSSSLSKTGILTISAPLPRALKTTGERLVPIKHS